MRKMPIQFVPKGADIPKEGKWVRNLLQQMWQDISFLMNRKLEFQTFTDIPDTKPAADTVESGTIIFVSDGAVGDKYRYSDGINWYTLG